MYFIDYWWKYKNEKIVIECDDPRFPILKKLCNTYDDIQEAEKIVYELKKGFLDPEKICEEIDV